MITTDPSHDATVISTGNFFKLSCKEYKNLIFFRNVGKHNRKGYEVFKPKCIIDYNKAKKGVDYSDQMSSYHTSVRKSLKWYR